MLARERGKEGRDKGDTKGKRREWKRRGKGREDRNMKGGEERGGGGGRGEEGRR